MRIQFFSSFCSSAHCKERVEQIYGRISGVEVVDDDSYSHAILLNTPMPTLSIPKERVMGFAFEPLPFLNLTPDFIQYARRHIGVYWIGTCDGLPAPFRAGFSFMWHIVPPKSLSPKTSLCSIMVSEKKATIGHRYRHELVQAILASNLPIDIYGRGCAQYAKRGGGDSRIRGEFTEMDSILYASYEFHIAIENFQIGHYISEKLLNPLLCGCTTFYWGSPEVETYFPNMVYAMSGNAARDLATIILALKDPVRYRKTIDVNGVERQTNFIRFLKNTE
jgi:hypothetical protein